MAQAYEAQHLDVEAEACSKFEVSLRYKAVSQKACMPGPGEIA